MSAYSLLFEQGPLGLSDVPLVEGPPALAGGRPDGHPPAPSPKPRCTLSPSIAKTILFQNNSGGGGGCEAEEGRKLLSNKCEARVEGRHHLRDAEHEPDFRHGQRNGSTKSKILNLYLKHHNNIDVAIFLGYLWHGCQRGNQKVLLFPLHFIKSELSLAGKMRRPPPLPRRPPRRSLFHCSNMCCPPRRRCCSRSGGRARERCVVC